MPVRNGCCNLFCGQLSYLLLTLFSCVLLPAVLQAESISFQKQIAPLIAEKCLDCHNDRESQGNLNLALKSSTFAGGDYGVVLVPGKSAESYLWERIATDEMPPKHPLTQEEKLLLKEWIDQGARWDGERLDPFAFTTESRAGYDWWALQPLKSQNIPAEFQGLHPVDAFVRNKLAEQNLQPSPRADRRTVIRRLSYDLHGLAPLPEEVRAFEADQTANAYENLVDRMLASPHYGERWARHWLDLARFGESHGFERDHIRDNSWPYRDWVINAFNSDLPYDQFVRLQIAGDILQPEDSEALTATGFLVAGPYDQVGQTQQSKAMRAVVRQDEMEDYLGTLGQTFLGLTVNCARCHDHKFDPITQTDYYRMSSALAGVAPGERPRKTPELQQQIVVLRQKLDQVHSLIAGLLDPVREQILAERKHKTSVENVPLPIARWTFDNDLQDEIGILHGTAHGEARIENGQLVLDGQTAYVSTVPLASSLKAKTLEAWVQLSNLTQRGGGVVSVQTTDGVLFDAIVFGEREPERWMAGSNGFVRTQPFQGEPESEADKSLVHVAIVYDEQGNIQGYRNGEPYGQPYKSEGPQEFNAGEFQILFGLRHGTSVGGNRLLAGRIEQAQIYDRALTADEIALTAGLFNILTRKQLVAKLAADQQQRLAELEQEDAQLNAQIRDLSTQKVYAISPRPPGQTHVLLRGNPGTPAEEVQAGGIASLSEVPADFGLPAEASDADRRKALAEWIANEHNPLFARVIVNRLWHYHFGAGIVRTPNDFGFNGSRPTHPELLDFLARYLVDHNWSLKAVHRLIVTSETYQQSSAPNAEGMKADAGNQWLWRYAPQRLEAEVIRDSMLRVTGTLNPQMGGPSYRNFDTYVHNSQFYEMQDKTGPEYHRRTIYRMWIRSGRNRFLDAFDCPDPSTTTPARAVTTTPTQSLSLLNNSFVLRMSDELTEKITGAGHQTPDTQVTAAYQLLFQRDPYPEEQRIAEPFVRQHGLPALARILFNTNEFLFAE